MRDLSRKLRSQDFEGAARLLGLNAEAFARDSHPIVSGQQAKDFAEGMLEGRPISEIASCLLEHSLRAR